MRIARFVIQHKKPYSELASHLPLYSLKQIFLPFRLSLAILTTKQVRKSLLDTAMKAFPPLGGEGAFNYLWRGAGDLSGVMTDTMTGAAYGCVLGRTLGFSFCAGFAAGTYL